MKLTSTQLRRIIKEEMSRYAEGIDKYGLSFDEQPLLALFGVSDLEELSDEDVKLAYDAIDAIKAVYKMRKSVMVASTSIEDRLKPISVRVANMNSSMSVKQSNDFAKRGVKFYSDQNGRVFAISPASGKVYAQPVGTSGLVKQGDLVPYTQKFDISKLGF